MTKYMSGNLVNDIMKSNVISIDSSMTVKDAAKMMNDAGVGCIVVMEKNSTVGILTERDFVRKIIAQEKSLSTPVKDVMSSPLITIDPNESVWELAQLMKVKHIHKVPVADKGKLIGIVTSTDLTRLCSIGSDAEMSKICDQILLRMK